MNNDYSIMFTFTETKKVENQDCSGIFSGSNFNLILVADGLGSYKYAKKSAEIVVNSLLRQAADYNSSEVKNSSLNSNALNISFKSAKAELVGYADANLEVNERKEDNLFGTTVIAIYETETKVKIGYVGNGAIWHIRGNFNEFPEPYMFPWNALNLLNPHTIPENGKEALYRLISDNADYNECIPSEIEIEKDRIVGDIFMICTDGIYSADQIKAGKNEKGIWLKYENSMVEFFKHLKHFFATADPYTSESLSEI